MLLAPYSQREYEFVFSYDNLIEGSRNSGKRKGKKKRYLYTRLNKIDLAIIFYYLINNIILLLYLC